MCEHLVDGYGRAWHTDLANGEVDSAIANTGLSRWHNYYLEGLAYLSKTIGMDGIYLDGTSYDREGMKRMRKALDAGKPGGLFDLHEGDNFKAGDGRVSVVLGDMELLPYIDSLWLGEIFDYENTSPDYWLVEVSGIPFGLYGDMLQMPINPWRGMLFGMSGRYWSGADPQYLWKFWDDFGIKDAEMIGWWDPKCPVWTGEAPGAWDHWPVKLRLRIDWKALGLDPAKVKLVAPEIPGFQLATTFAVGDEIPVEAGKGWLIEARE